MSTSDTQRETLRRARDHLEEWVVAARDQAYRDLFEGPDAALDEADLALLDRIDSDLTRQGDPGLWGADEYAIVDTGGGPRVRCTTHPEIPGEGYRGRGSLSESTRSTCNDRLWEYCERVATLLQEDLEAFLADAGERED